jgi:serine/threonine protein kinase/WD40 repeat protein/tetratricopeptide (TPR) repeat protein
MPSSDPSRDVLLQQLAEEFVQRQRRGERPALSEYAERHPDLAADIRDLFPALVKIERLKPAAGDLTGAFIGESGPADGHTPERLGEYRILREVGHGGMGVVYEAEQESLGRHVALKVLPRQALLKATYLERFRREAKASARLHHTNIVPVFGVGECDGTHYYAMQFIRGEGLDKVLRDLRRLRATPGGPTVAAPSSEGSVAHSLLTGRFAAPEAAPAEERPGRPTLSPGTAADGTHGCSTLSAGGPEADYFRGIARVAVQVADALAYAHRQGILHRDIKPSNLLLDQQGTVWVTDFGLAKAEGTDDLTQAGDIVGTIRFMAPERFDGRSAPQSDVYALGATLYELLTLRPAFDDVNKARLVGKVLHEPPPPPRKLDPRIPGDLETIVLKCLAKEPTERYATADILAEDLRRFLADRPIKARRTPWHERTWRWCRRNPAVASLLATVAVLLVAVAVVSTVMAARLNGALGRTQAAERQARLREAEALVGQAHGLRYSRREGQRFKAVAALRKALAIGRELGQPPEWFDPLRNEAVAALALPDVEVVQQWDVRLHEVGMTFDGAMERYAYSDEHGNVSVRRVADDAVVVPLPGSGSAADAYLSPDSHWLAVHDLGTMRLKVWRLTDSAQELIHEGRDVTRWGVDFSPDNQRLLYIHRDSHVSIVTLADRQVTHWPARGTHAAGPLFRPDGSQVVFLAQVDGQNTALALVCDARTGGVVAKLPHPAKVAHYGWHPAGRMIATCCDDRRIRLWDTTTWQQTLVLDGHKTFGIRCAFTPDGDRLLSNDYDALLRVWDVHSGRQLFATPMSNGMNRMGRDGRLPVYDGNQMKLIRVAVGREFRTLTRRTGAGPGGSANGYGAQAALSADGRLLAVPTDDGTCALVDPASGAELAMIPGNQTVASRCEASGAFLTWASAGLWRWPVRREPPTGRCDVGPPQLLSASRVGEGHASSADGSVVVIANTPLGALLLHRDRPGPPRVLGQQEDVRRGDVSPDGRWVATGNWHDHQGIGAKVWEAASGRLVKDLRVSGGCSVGFSPEGKWLLTTGGGCRLWAVGTWAEGPFIGKEAGFAFSPDGQLLAVGGRGGEPAVIRLVEPATGREYVRLEAPEQTRLAPQCFTPDGTQLIAYGVESRSLYVWDLRLIRKQLDEMGLDWDAPPYPPLPGAAEDVSPEPLQVRVDLGEQEDDAVLGDPGSPGELCNVIVANSLLLAFAPLDYKAYRQRGRAEGRAGLNRAAIADYSAALSLMAADDLNRVDLLSRRAGNHLILGEHDQALADIRQAEQLDPARGPRIRFIHASALVQRAAQQQGRAAALRALREALDLAPEYAEAHNNLAWLLLTKPQNPGDADEALRHARKAIELTADQPVYLNTLSVALYRNGQPAEAVPVLEKSLAAGKGRSDGFNLFFLAMCHAKLGEPDKAKDCFDRAVKWTEAQKNLAARHLEELKAFRAEAEAALEAP